MNKEYHEQNFYVNIVNSQLFYIFYNLRIAK